MLNTRDSMREGTNERTYTTTKHITTLLLRSRVKIKKKYYISINQFLIDHRLINFFYRSLNDFDFIKKSKLIKIDQSSYYPNYPKILAVAAMAASYPGVLYGNFKNS